MAILLRKKILLVCLGLVFSLIGLELAMRIAGSVVRSAQEYSNRSSLRHKNTFRILCVGESTTQKQYPRFLESILNSRAGFPKFSVIDKGESSVNSYVIVEKIGSYISQYHPDMIVAMMGNNDRGLTIPADYPFDQRKAHFWERSSIYKAVKLLAFYAGRRWRREDRVSPPLPRMEALAGGGQADPLNRDAFLRDLPKRYPLQIVFLKNLLRADPDNAVAWQKLGTAYLMQGSYIPARNSFTRSIYLNRAALRKNPGIRGGLSRQFYDSYVRLAETALHQGRLRQAEKFCKLAIGLDPGCPDAYCRLVDIAFAGGGAKADIRLVEDYAASQEGENAYLIYGMLGVFYEQSGNEPKARHYYGLARSGRMNNVCFHTVKNYWQLKRIADSRHIRLVCVQYPMLSVIPLKNIFSSRGKDIIFVDNEKSFKDVVSREGYRAYFLDMFGGEFGHCTDKGNRLLAQNIADAIENNCGFSAASREKMR